MSTATQTNRPLYISTPLGEDILILTSISGREELSRPFRFELGLLSEDPAIDPENIVGMNVTFAVRRGDDDRYFNGYVSRFTWGERKGKLRRYRAEIVPWMWFLTQLSDCRIFQDRTVPEIIEQVFTDRGLGDYDLGVLRGWQASEVGRRKLSYCVQYNETDFDFVSRLMEEHGIFYFFRHENGNHTLVLADDPAAYEWSPQRELRLESEESEVESLTSWRHDYRVAGGGCAHTDFNYESPRLNLLAGESNGDGKPLSALERYAFPGRYGEKDQGQKLAKIRLEERQSDRDRVMGETTARGLSAAHKFTIADPLLEGDDGKSYAVVNIEHTVAAAFAAIPLADDEPQPGYKNRIECLPAEALYRPPRITPRPVAQGPHTAIVVGPDGQEIYTDKLGRIKVHFPWDREGNADENSSCWIRVAQVHASNGWGAMHVPRIGEEVIVDFLHGDPDQPIVTGRVYNGENLPPFELPTEKAVSGFKSNSTPGGGGFNQFSFDDTKDAEKIVTHAQKDQITVVENDRAENVKHDEGLVVDNDRTREVGNDERIYIKHDQHIVIDNEARITIKGERNEAVAENMTTYCQKSITLVAEEELLLQVGKSRLYLRKDGQIVIDGVNVLIGARGQFAYEGETIEGSARSRHIVRGAVIRHNCD